MNTPNTPDVWLGKAHEVFLRIQESKGRGLTIHRDVFLDHIRGVGISLDDARISEFVDVMRKNDDVSESRFCAAFLTSSEFLYRVFEGDLIIPNWGEFVEDIKQIYTKCVDYRNGTPSANIPDTGRGDVDDWVVSVCSVDGQIATFGDSGVQYSVQSNFVPFTYAHVHSVEGDKIHKFVGREPSGRTPNKLCLNDEKKPHNPLINSGAIACCSMIEGDDVDHKMEMILESWRLATGSTSFLKVNKDVLESEKRGGHRNRALAYLIDSFGNFPPETPLEDALEIYFRSNSIEIDPKRHAIAVGTLATGGICPVTGQRVFDSKAIRDLLSIMFQCGMYDFSGQYCYEIGLPAKSSSSGSIAIVVPGLLGIVCYSPRLDVHGNSVRGIQFSKELVKKFRFHQFDFINTKKKHPRVEPASNRLSAFHAVEDGDIHVIKFLLQEGLDPNFTNIDGRTMLHEAATRNLYNMVFFLLTHGSDPQKCDTHGVKPAECCTELAITELFDTVEQGKSPSYDPPAGTQICEMIIHNQYESREGALNLPVIRKLDFSFHYFAEYLWTESETSLGRSLYEYIADKGDVSLSNLREFCRKSGIMDDDPRLHGLFCHSESDLKAPISISDFLSKTHRVRTFLHCIMKRGLAINDWERFTNEISQIFHLVKDTVPSTEGNVASYIPSLAKVDPNLWAVGVCTIHGQRFSVGDSKVKYTMQSTSKVISYAVAKEDMDAKGHSIHQYVGQEPSGRLFNKVTLNSQGRPHNPMVNAGAIMCCSLIDTERSAHHRVARIQEVIRRAIGGSQPVTTNDDVYKGEYATASRNRCLSYFMEEKRIFPPNNEVDKTLRVYLKMCATELTVEEHSILAATLANGGICPLTNERIFSVEVVKRTLTLMFTCGMYDNSGEFGYLIGLPAKSGVSGVIMIVIPNVMGICTYSPPIAKTGTPLRGFQFCNELVRRLPFHQFDVVDPLNNKWDPRGHRARSSKLSMSIFPRDTESTDTLVTTSSMVFLQHFTKSPTRHSS